MTNMLQLDFKKFIEKLDEDKQRRPTLHYVETEEKFILLFKNREFWEYFTVVLKESIISFGELYGANSGQEVEDFRINYLSQALEIMGEDDLPKELDPELLTPSQVVKSAEPIEAGSEMVEESEEYEAWFSKVVDGWEKKVLNALQKANLEKVYKPDFQKTFGEFVREMMNTVNTIPFMRVLRRIIKKNMVIGMESAEVELDVQIGFGKSSQAKLDVLEDQQLTGYTIQGKKWHGLRGAAKETQFRVLKVVEEGVRERKTTDQMAKEVKQVFEGATMSQAKRIARTESNRFVNEGRITAYKDSGVEGRKAYAAVMDSKTADICKRMHSKYFDKGIPYDEPFIDDVTGKSAMTPPGFHPNCRCVIEWRPEPSS